MTCSSNQHSGSAHPYVAVHLPISSLCSGPACHEFRSGNSHVNTSLSACIHMHLRSIVVATHVPSMKNFLLDQSVHYSGLFGYLNDICLRLSARRRLAFFNFSTRPLATGLGLCGIGQRVALRRFRCVPDGLEWIDSLALLVRHTGLCAVA